MQKKVRLTALIIVVTVAGLLGIRWWMASHASAIDAVAARSTGNLQARVKIVEFIDFECPACANGAKMLKEYMERYPNDLHVQMKYFPLTNMHAHAIQSALYSECAARQGKFWALHEQMMPAQQQWSTLVSADPIFQTMAKGVGLNMGQLNACLASEDAKKTINDERSLGQSLGVKSTPTYFINNKMVVGTKLLTEELNQLFPPS